MGFGAHDHRSERIDRLVDRFDLFLVLTTQNYSGPHITRTLMPPNPSKGVCDGSERTATCFVF